jgi:hypothetical protein
MNKNEFAEIFVSREYFCETDITTRNLSYPTSAIQYCLFSKKPKILQYWKVQVTISFFRQFSPTKMKFFSNCIKSWPAAPPPHPPPRCCPPPCPAPAIQQQNFGLVLWIRICNQRPYPGIFMAMGSPCHELTSLDDSTPRSRLLGWADSSRGLKHFQVCVACLFVACGGKTAGVKTEKFHLREHKKACSILLVIFISIWMTELENSTLKRRLSRLISVYLWAIGTVPGCLPLPPVPPPPRRCLNRRRWPPALRPFPRHAAESEP